MGYNLLSTAATSLANNPMFLRLMGGDLNKAESVTDELINKWKSPCRFYHSINNHLLPMLDQIDGLHINRKRDEYILKIAAWFHDCVYDPKSADNEKNSMKYFYDSVSNYDEDATVISELIKMTMDFKNVDTDLKSGFADLDLAYLKSADASDIDRNELLMLKEFQFADYSLYKQRRIEILKELWGNKCINWINASRINDVCRYLEYHRPRIGIYPGSFNPFHVGHLSILKEAEKLFDKVIVEKGINPEKASNPKVPSGLDDVKKILPYHQVEYFSTFLHEYVEKKSRDADITVVRGFRSGYDIDYELRNLAFMRDMSDNVKTVFIAPQKEFDHVSSTAIRLIKNFSSKESDKYIPRPYYPAP